MDPHVTRCDICLETYNLLSHDDKNPHFCSNHKLRERVANLEALADSILRVLAIETVWTFSLDDDVFVKVEFHGKGKLRAKHIRAFAKIFHSLADNYVVPEEPQEHP